MTNILAALVVMVVTNDVPQWQHKEVTVFPTYPPQTEERWVEGEFGVFGLGGMEKRINPEFKVSEVHRISNLEFQYDGKEYKVLIKDELLETRRLKRIINTEEKWEVVSNVLDIVTNYAYTIMTNDLLVPTNDNWLIRKDRK